MYWVQEYKNFECLMAALKLPVSIEVDHGRKKNSGSY